MGESDQGRNVYRVEVTPSQPNKDFGIKKHWSKIKRFIKVFGWSIGTYTATFYLADTIYDNKSNSIQNRANGIYLLILKENTVRPALELIPAIQNQRKPFEPKFSNFLSFFKTLFFTDRPDLQLNYVLQQIIVAHKTNLNRINLTGVNLEKAFLDGANLKGANLEGANLKRTRFEKADLSKFSGFPKRSDGTDEPYHLEKQTNLSGAKLQNADLFLANLDGANLEGANLERANLKNAGLFEADLSEADLEGAKNLDCGQIKSAKSIKEAKFPSYIKITWNGEDSFECEDMIDKREKVD